MVQDCPPSTISELYDRLELIERELADARNLHCLFVTAYKLTTAKAGRAMAAITDTTHPDRPRYGHLDGSFLERCMVEFGRLYFNAFDHYRAGQIEKVPPAWRIAFETSAQPNCWPSVAIVLGFNAHISRDLPLVLSMREAYGPCLYNPRDGRHRQTYRMLNDMMLEELPLMLAHAHRVEAMVMKRWQRAIARLVHGWHQFFDWGPFSALAARLFVLSRAEAEWHAAQLSRGSITTDDIDRLTADRARYLRRRTWWLWISKTLYLRRIQKRTGGKAT